MYGPDDTDPVVKHYDETVGISGESELNWYLEKVKLFGGPVLDLACGTGRIALLLSERGYDVVGIDDSEGMLSIFRKKLLECMMPCFFLLIPHATPKGILNISLMWFSRKIL